MMKFDLIGMIYSPKIGEGRTEFGPQPFPRPASFSLRAMSPSLSGLDAESDGDYDTDETKTFCRVFNGLDVSTPVSGGA